jgi:hypothetical protein
VKQKHLNIYNNYREIIDGLVTVESDLNSLYQVRENLIQSFDQALGQLRLPMRLRKRSGGYIAWRNIAARGKDQRDYNLSEYQSGFDHLPQPIQRQILDYDKNRLLFNLNWSTLSHEKKQLEVVIQKLKVTI